MPQLTISLVMLYQPTRSLTVVLNSDSQSAWKTLPSTQPAAAAMLAGNILAIGGDETSDSRGGSEMKEVYMYSSSTDSWIYISDLPAPRVSTAAAVLSSTELLVIGGWNRGRVNTMYKGTLTLL